ncbi:MAG: GatB/YqeY domain-containing protein [Treponemataceae bacterium]|nr:GatB/YqeY domain-containing protein [Treponemataceae bacterium]
MTLKEMNVERLKIRKEDPVRANVLTMLVNAVKNVTIDERRPETDADFAKAAVKMYNETKNNIEVYKKNGADTADLEAELAVVETFLPKMLSEDQMIAEAKKLIESMPEDQRVLKSIMPRLKEIEGFDMKMAKSIVDKVLAK